MKTKATQNPEIPGAARTRGPVTGPGDLRVFYLKGGKDACFFFTH